MPEEFPHESIVPFQHHRAVVNAVESAHNETRRKLAKAERDRDRYADRIESLRAENAALRAKYADNWHDPPQVGDHKWVKMVFRGQGLPREFEYEGVEHDAK